MDQSALRRDKPAGGEGKPPQNLEGVRFPKMIAFRKGPAAKRYWNDLCTVGMSEEFPICVIHKLRRKQLSS